MNGVTENDWKPVNLDDTILDNTIIAQLNFLGGVERDELDHLFQKAIKVKTCVPGEVIFSQDTSIEHVYVLLSGEARQSRVDDENGEVRRTLMRTIYQGAMPGVYDFLFNEQSDNQFRTTTQAVSACIVLSIKAAALNRLLYHYPNKRAELAPMDLISRLRTIPLVGQEGRQDLVTLGFLADAAEQRRYKPDSVIYRAGEDVQDVFINSQGQVRLDWDNQSRSWLGTGAAFTPEMRKFDSEMHEFDRTAQAHTATTETLTDLIVISLASFRDILGWDPVERVEKKAKQREVALEYLFSKLFEDRNFSAEQRSLLAGFMSHYYFPIKHVLIQQGEQANSLWMLMEGGQAEVHALDQDGGKLPPTISVGPTYFAETALLGEVPQDSTVEALADSEWLRLYWSDFRDYDEAEPVDMRPLLKVSVKDGEIVTREGHGKRYPWLHRGEVVIVLSRRHWIAFLRKGIPAFITFLILLVVTFLGALFKGYQWWIAVPAGILSILALAFFIWGAIDYFNDWILVTNQRVVHQEKVLFINEWRKEAPLEQIQNVNFQSTFLGRWLNYGTMIIQTASTSGVISFDYTRNFSKLNRVIEEQRIRRRRHAVAQSKMTIHRMLGKRLGLELVLPKKVYRGGRLRPPEITQPQRATAAMRWQVGDKIIWRRHWMALLPKVWWAVLILLFWVVMLFLPQVLPAFSELSGLGFVFVAAVRVVSWIGVIVAFVRVAWVVANWRNDTYEVSDDSLVHVEKLPLSLVEDRKTASLGNIQNVEMYINNPLEWLFNFGNVVCQTAAEEGDFTFTSVPDPRSVADEIQRRIERFRRQSEVRAVQQRAKDLPDWFEVYNTLEWEELEQHKPFQ